MQQARTESAFDPHAWAEVQDRLRQLVQTFDAMGLLDPGRSDEEAFPAMEQAAKEDADIASSLKAMAGKPWLYLFVAGPPSADEQSRDERRRDLVDKLLPVAPEPADKVRAIARGLEVHPKSDHQPDPQKVERVRGFIEKQRLMDPSDDVHFLTQLLEGLGSCRASGAGSSKAQAIAQHRR